MPVSVRQWTTIHSIHSKHQREKLATQAMVEFSTKRVIPVDQYMDSPLYDNQKKNTRPKNVEGRLLNMDLISEKKRFDR